MVDTQLLNSYIKNSGYRKDFISSKLSISKQALSRKINNQTEFKSAEVMFLQELLGLSDTEFRRIFFTKQCEFKPQEQEARK